VDTAAARFEIAHILNVLNKAMGVHTRNRPRYYMDLGNSQHTGQVILSTVGKIEQPSSKKFDPVAALPMITDEFKALLQSMDKQDDTPSCSHAEALAKQDLFINSSLVNVGASLLWQMFREGMLTSRGFFMNLSNYRTVPVPVQKSGRRGKRSSATPLKAPNISDHLRGAAA
jgi:PRTRC genetic system ThiF family protein